MKLSIVIPTYNREKILEMTLRGLDTQTKKPHEIIIIDDGSNPKSLEYTQKVIDSINLPIEVIHNKPDKGPASARNKGIRKAKGDYVLFIDDDSIPENDKFIENHIKFAIKHPESAVLGKLIWHHDTQNYCLRGKWTSKLGFDVGYEENMEMTFIKYCTANILVPKKLLERCMFNEEFPYAAIEDTEWGYRMHQLGVDLKYNPNACALHYHRYDCGMLADRQKRAGEALAIFVKLHPELYEKYKPTFSKSAVNLLKGFINSPFIKLFPSDLQYFLIGLFAKYNTFWKSYKS